MSLTVVRTGFRGSLLDAHGAHQPFYRAPGHVISPRRNGRPDLARTVDLKFSSRTGGPSGFRAASRWLGPIAWRGQDGWRA